MRVVLVGPEFEENLSIRYLSSSLRAAGHEPTLARFDRMDDAEQVLENADHADMVGLSMCFQVRAREFLSLARKLKERRPNLPIVLGGHYASCAATPLLENHPEIDLVVLHEGEQTLVDLADAGDALATRVASIPGLAYRHGSEVRLSSPRPMLEDLDKLPTPDRGGPIRRQAGVPISYILGSRGCIGACTYCCITTLHRLATGPRFRQRAPEKVADEMATLYHERHTRQFAFHDDNFLVPSVRHNHRRLDAFDAELEKRDVRDFTFTIKCRPQDLKEEVARRLRDRGLLRLFLGIESGTEAGLRCLNRTQTVRDAERALSLCADLGLSAQYTIMIFNPDSTMASIRADIDFMRRHPDHAVNFCRTEIYAGTPLERRMIEEGRARGNYLARSYSLLDPSADLMCRLWARLFHDRCSDQHGLMNLAIGMDYRSAAVETFYGRKQVGELRQGILAWRRAVHVDTLDLLEALADLCSSGGDPKDKGFQRALRDFEDREKASRFALLAQGAELRHEVDLLSQPQPAGSRDKPVRATSARRHLAALSAPAAVLILAGAVDCGGDTDASEMAPPALIDTDDDNLPDDCERTVYGTDPDLADTDGDGVPDGQEDHDNDGITNEEEQAQVGPNECPSTNPADAGVDVPMSEMAPPPLDAGIDVPMSEMAPPPLDASDDIPMSEMAPPPLDASDDLMAEMAPPPLDASDDIPMSEMAPPPLDASDDVPMSEMAPPPLDGGDED